jgi:peptidoglycan-N-acetylglucosamine deacetylase
MRLFRPCFLAVHLFPEALFREKTTEKVLYLTFDDGPDVLSTFPILEILESNKVKALFFCSGKAASKNPQLVEKIRSDGHIVGNHGYYHLNGLFNSKRTYLNDVETAAGFTSRIYFRPPYGRMKISQYSELKKRYKIIMWDIMPYDFDNEFGCKRSLAILKKMARSGSVIVLHDSYSSCAPVILNEFLKFAVDEGYRFILPEIKSG